VSAGGAALYVEPRSHVDPQFDAKRKLLAMRTIPTFLISFGLWAGCTLYPKEGGPDDTPPPEPTVPVCAEACTSDAQCWDGTVCNGGTCTQCKTDAECGPGGHCSEGTCFACTEDAHCAASPKGKLCAFDPTSPAATTCGECLADADCKDSPKGNRCGPDFQCACTDAAKHCAAPNALCRQEGCVCSEDAGCTKGAKKCELGVCIACAADADCADFDDGDPATPLPTKCFDGGTLGAYCGCAADAECTSGLCDVMSGTCVECKVSADCAGNPAGEVCLGGSCGQCETDQHCVDTKRGSACVDGACTCGSAAECNPNITGSALSWVCE
jgi:hypothetical protein